MKSHRKLFIFPLAVIVIGIFLSALIIYRYGVSEMRFIFPLPHLPIPETLITNHLRRDCAPIVGASLPLLSAREAGLSTDHPFVPVETKNNITEKVYKLF